MHTQTHKETLTHKHTHGELSPTPTHTSDLIRVEYLAQLRKWASSEGILCQLKTPWHLMSLSVQVISCFSTFLVLYFVLDPLFSLSIFCCVLLMPHMDQKGKHRNTPLTQGDNNNIHDNSSQGRGENKRYNQSISPITQQKLQGTMTFNTTDKATGRTHTHIRTYTRVYTGDHSISLLLGEWH